MTEIYIICDHGDYGEIEIEKLTSTRKPTAREVKAGVPKMARVFEVNFDNSAS